MSIYGNNVLDSGLMENKLLENTKNTMAGNLRMKTPSQERAFEENLFHLETRELLNKLDSIADKLFRYPSQGVLENYRNVVGQILQKAEGMLEIRRDFSLSSGTPRMLVDRTKKGLKELEEILGREGRRSRIMGITEDIRGCLVSLVA